jgi:hypothetical protein
MSSISRRAGAALRAALIGGAILVAPQERSVMAQRAPTAAPARDGDIAIREEYEAARRVGTAAAYDLFLARHPDHPLAETARRERPRSEGSPARRGHAAKP